LKSPLAPLSKGGSAGIYTEAGNDMKTPIQIKLFASLGRYMPENGDAFLIDPGLSVRDLALCLGIPLDSARLIFVNGVKRDLSATLTGGERVAIFPPVGGG
jgi:sulfur-carrier protein